jgi:hypothetical protein
MRWLTQSMAKNPEGVRRLSGAECLMILAFVVGMCVAAASLGAVRGSKPFRRGSPPAAAKSGGYPAHRGTAVAAH